MKKILSLVLGFALLVPMLANSQENGKLAGAAAIGLAAGVGLMAWFTSTDCEPAKNELQRLDKKYVSNKSLPSVTSQEIETDNKKRKEINTSCLNEEEKKRLEAIKRVIKQTQQSYDTSRIKQVIQDLQQKYSTIDEVVALLNQDLTSSKAPTKVEHALRKLQVKGHEIVSDICFLKNKIKDIEDGDLKQEYKNLLHKLMQIDNESKVADAITSINKIKNAYSVELESYNVNKATNVFFEQRALESYGTEMQPLISYVQKCERDIATLKNLPLQAISPTVSQESGLLVEQLEKIKKAMNLKLHDKIQQELRAYQQSTHEQNMRQAELKIKEVKKESYIQANKMLEKYLQDQQNLMRETFNRMGSYAHAHDQEIRAIIDRFQRLMTEHNTALQQQSIYNNQTLISMQRVIQGFEVELKNMQKVLKGLENQADLNSMRSLVQSLIKQVQSFQNEMESTLKMSNHNIGVTNSNVIEVKKMLEAQKNAYSYVPQPSAPPYGH